ncbi:glycosyltransferase [Flavobacteriaceae bacterium]|nr:glycosyltransferase [Flavobacteriaceae bacterium]
MKPLLSIIIATKNRVPYCINSIETILSYTNNDFELVVQDNTDNFELRNYVYSDISDKRLVYNYIPPPFSSIDNFNAGLELATGEYVCLIGDDDGICSTIFEVVKWAKLNKVDSVCPRVFVDYYWPDAFKKGSLGYLTIPKFTNRVWSKDPKKEIQNLVNDGVINYMKFDLPKFYHGLIKKSCFEEIKSKNGYYIGGLSPDIYAAVSLSNVVKKHMLIDFPLTIAGACKVSTTVAGFNGGHSGELKDAPHFRDKGNYVWDKQIPTYYSVQTIWAESALKAIHDNEIVLNLKKLNVAKILAKSILDAPIHLKLFLREALKTVSNKNIFFLKFIFQILLLFFKTYYFKVINKIFLNNLSSTNIINIKEATKQSNIRLVNLDVTKSLNTFNSFNLNDNL